MAFDIVALGELLIDFTPVEDRTFFANPGGAPPNVLAASAKLGCRCALICMVGQDGFGRMLEKDMQQAGVDTAGLRYTDKAPTTLAFVQLDEKGDRSFTFVRKPGADMLLTTEEVDFGLINGAKIFHFGGVSITGEPSRATTFEAARYAKEKGLVVSYDPNLRPLLWNSLEEAKEVLLRGFAYADIVKVSEEEVEFLTGETDMAAGAQKLHAHGPRLVFVTLGPAGCFYSAGGHTGYMPTYDLVVKDTTGAGDAFMGGILASIVESGQPLDALLAPEALEEMVDFANAVGALATTRSGGVRSMPLPEEIVTCRATVEKLILT